MNLISVEDPNDPRLADYADLRDADLMARERSSTGGLFMAEGELVVRLLLESPFRIRSVLLTPTRLATVRDALEARLPAGVPVYLVPQSVMNGVVGFNIHRGILAAAERGQPLDPAGVVAAAKCLVILEDLSNHDNVGGIFRNAAALGGGGAAVLLSPGCADPLYRKAIRVSMGHALRVPFARLARWPEDLAMVAAGGFTLVGLDPDAGSVPVDRVDIGPGRPALLLGAEGPGLSGGAVRRCHVLARIPMTPGVDSLNVTCAAAIALHRLAGRSV